MKTFKITDIQKEIWNKMKNKERQNKEYFIIRITKGIWMYLIIKEITVKVVEIKGFLLNILKYIKTLNKLTRAVLLNKKIMNKIHK